MKRHKRTPGIIYQAGNASYLGRATPRTLHVLADGSVLSPRALQKIRASERGWRYAVDQLERAGAAPLVDQEPRAWLRQQLPRVARTLRHPGNHKYAWALQRASRATPAFVALSPTSRRTRLVDELLDVAQRELAALLDRSTATGRVR